MHRRTSWRALITALVIAIVSLAARPTFAAEPIRIGFSMALTGPSAVIGKQVLLALEIWRDDVNAKGGLIGRPVDLVYYDDQSQPPNVPGIYTKLINVDKVDLLIGPYATNMIAAAMPVVIQSNKMTLGIFGLLVNGQFKYKRYFSMLATGPSGALGFSQGFFELAKAQSPKPRTVAIVSADAEFARTASDGARENAKAAGFEIVYDRRYPPNTTDYAPIVRAVQATGPDIAFVAAYPPDSVGIVRAASEINFAPKLFGGTMVGLLATNIKMQLGPLLNGIVNHEDFVPGPSFNFPGVGEMLATYRARAQGQGVDPLGYAFAPFAYAAGQVLAAAVEQTKSLDHDRLATHIHASHFKTVVGEVAFGEDGEWAQSRMMFTQFQNVTGSDIEQFKDSTRQVIVWPAEYKTGSLVYPYAEARRK